jgi:hypothetical protein
MDSCEHTFTWHAVIPPTHCPTCGKCLSCGQGQYVQPHPIYPPPWRPITPNPWASGTALPWTYTTSDSTSTTH